MNDDKYLGCFRNPRSIKSVEERWETRGVQEMANLSQGSRVVGVAETLRNSCVKAAVRPTSRGTFNFRRKFMEFFLGSFLVFSLIFAALPEKPKDPEPQKTEESQDVEH